MDEMRKAFEAEYPLAKWEIEQLGEPVARALKDQHTKREWEGFQKGWKAATARECQAMFGADDICGLPPDSPIHSNPNGHKFQY